MQISAFWSSIVDISRLVMVSKTTEAATRVHLEKVVAASGLSPEQITIFCQSEIPAFDNEGNLLLSSRHSIVTAPRFLYSWKKILEGGKIKKKKFQATILKQPGELVGSVCLDKGVPRVTEYSELGPELAERKADDGRLLFCAGSIANHLYSLEFLESFCNNSFHLPYHRASKKIPHVASDGSFVKPTVPNGIKLEQFVFDVFERSKNFYIWEVEREDEFSPLKNADSAGKDCLSTCKRDLAVLNK
ncbi:UTP--glucose-1-phosphate uridylyltransferase [Necator americanus]|uniref:UTP--glucose-1-phosphate uridylyltransferase n=1 Tax=Necator americanus TaxID=51031 RepID=W2T525_NECAM|nr:UTP--glucose-1-phosphate uridylyltransferase [Necator americanus]ETN77135.1 UTP--glucose-1-phosphate uridylyltransferase [Necator americanus]